ncbi:MAG: OmpA family protein [Elusimicrobia bacterium]|nr:OmpA family protein [Elusimicrobiota bacterium]
MQKRPETALAFEHRRWPRIAAGIFVVWGILTAVGAPPRLAAQYLEERSTAGLSRTMQLAIRDYDDGRDSDAMDGFMEVMTSGDPSERNMANEYINLITQRMFLGSTVNTKPVVAGNPRPATTVEPLPRESGGGERRGPAMEVDTRPLYDRPDRMPSRQDLDPPKASKAVMKKEVDAKIRALARTFLSDLEAYPEIRVLMADRQHPRALGIPAEVLFESGIVFKKSAAKLLSSFSGLVYCLGATQVAILPEGMVVGDAKILDMRRTMGISAHLYATGVAPPRVRVNLLNSQIEVPKGMMDFRGIVVVFIYNQPLSLTVDRTLGDDGGPPVSLGVWPEKFRADRGEGSIIEFSVVEPPSGLMSWKFQLRQPSAGQGSDLIPLQEVVGAAPVFHQIYWNGRRNYFGPELAPGRYEIVLTATDSRNRTRTLHRWVQLDGVAPAAAIASAPMSPTSPAPAELKPAKSAGPAAPVAFVQLKRKGEEAPCRGKKCKKAKKTPPKKEKDPLEYAEAPPDPVDSGPQLGAAQPNNPPAGDPNAQPAPPPAQSEGAEPGAGKPPPNTVSYHVPFLKGTSQMSPEGDKAIGQIVEVLQNYPRENVNVVGIAGKEEPDAQGLADKRANIVSKLLMSQYGVDAKRIMQEKRVVAEDQHEVQIFSVTAKE